MHTPSTPSSNAPPVLSGSSGVAASSMRSFSASATDAHSGSSSTPNTRPARPASAPSTVFSATLPVKPSVTITSADVPQQVAALDVADPALHLGEQRRTRPCAARRPCPAPRRSRAARRSARRRRGAPGRTRGRATPTRPATRAAGRPSRRRRSAAAARPAPNVGQRHRDRGPVHAADAAEAEQRGGHRGAGVARADQRLRPGLRAPPGRRRRATSPSWCGRPTAGSSSIAITSEAASTSTRVGRDAAGQVRGDGVGIADEQELDVELGRGAQAAGHDLRGRAVAAHRVERDHRRHGVAPIIAAVRSPRRRVGQSTSRTCRPR